MANERDGVVLRQIRALYIDGAIREHTDGQLLERFVSSGSEAAETAFAVLVERHGPMVLRVCRGVLADPSDAQDAFQATFLVLVRKARGLWTRDSIGPWLHRVAYRTAVCARSAAACRQRHERTAAAGATEGQPPAGIDHQERSAALHEELAGLPEHYRAALVLYHLEGLACEEVASRLGWPVGTVRSRLVRGRERLKIRLIRRGLAPAAVLGAVLDVPTARAGMPEALVKATIDGAVWFASRRLTGVAISVNVLHLVSGVTRMMALAHMKTAAGMALVGAVIVLGAGVLAQQQPAPQVKQNGRAPESQRKGTVRGKDAKGIEDIRAINSEWDKVVINAVLARRKAKTPAELEQVQNDLSASEHRFVERCMELASRQPDSAAGLIALRTVAGRSPQTEEGRRAASHLIRQAATVDLNLLATMLDFGINDMKLRTDPVMPVILERVKKNLAHPKAARLLDAVACGSADPQAMKPSSEFIEAADLIVERYADSPAVRGICETLESLSESQTWPAAFENHLRTILVRNQHRAVRAAASYALASVIALAGESRQAEAETLYEEAIKTYDGSQPYYYANIEKALNARAKDKLAELKAIGKPAPEIEGIDLDGRAMKLSDDRGKVVLVSFWATWCRPCMKMIPQERALLRRFEGKPFVIIGVNGDDDPKAAKAAAAQHGVTWPSFRNKRGGQTISLAWHVWGWPTFYLIDQDGVIRERWNDTRPEAMEQAIDRLLGGPTERETAR